MPERCKYCGQFLAQVDFGAEGGYDMPISEYEAAVARTRPAEDEAVAFGYGADGDTIAEAMRLEDGTTHFTVVGPTLGGIAGLTEKEADDYWAAIDDNDE